MFTKMFVKKLFKLQLLPDVNKLQEIKIKMSAEQPNTTGNHKIPPSPFLSIFTSQKKCYEGIFAQ